MKVFDIDWSAFLLSMGAWERLEPPVRAFLIELKSNDSISLSGIGGEGLRLIAEGYLRPVGDGNRAKPAEGFRQAHRVLCALARHPLLVRKDPGALREYLGEHLTLEERRGLSSDTYTDDPTGVVISAVTSVSHVREFLSAKDRREWEREHLPSSGWHGRGSSAGSRALLTSKAAADDLARLIEILADAGGPVRLATLAERIAPLPRAGQGAAIRAGLRYLLCFSALDAEFLPVLMLWPGVAERLRRGPAPAPQPAQPRVTFCLAYRMEDLTQLLVRAAEPLRVKSDGWRLFASAERELEDGVLPLPDWLSLPKDFPECAPAVRMRAALELARELDFLAERGRPGRDLGLVTTPAGWAWLNESPRERLRVLLDMQRPALPPSPSPKSKRKSVKRSNPIEVLFGLIDADLEALGLDGENFDRGGPPDQAALISGRYCLSDYALFSHDVGGGPSRAAIAAYGSLEPGRPVLLSGFLHHSESANPFLELERSQRIGLGGYWNPPSEEMLDELWLRGLQQVLHHHLLPSGGVSIGLDANGALSIEITSVGRYLLGLAETFELDLPAAPDARAPVRVQPDFEVVFVAPNPAIDAAIGRFAERIGRGVGVLFRITRASILSAAQSRLSVDEALATLTNASATPIPPNVEHEIRAWFASCRRLHFESVELVRCPDPATAARVLGAAGSGKLEALTDTILMLADLRHRAAVVRACRKFGLFLSASPTSASAPRAKAHRYR